MSRELQKCIKERLLYMKESWNRKKKQIVKFCSRYKELTFCLDASIVVIALYFIHYDVPELFPKAGLLFDIAFQLSIGYIINFFFFVVNIYLPKLDDERKATTGCHLAISLLCGEIRDMENIFSSFINIKYNHMRYPEGQVYYQRPDSDFMGAMNITTYLKREYSVMQQKFSAVASNRYFGLLDSEVSGLINDLQYSDFMRYLRRFSDIDCELGLVFFGKMSYTDGLEDAYRQFIKLAEELQKLTNARVSPPKRFTIVEEAVFLEYAKTFEEKLASGSLKIQK